MILHRIHTFLNTYGLADRAYSRIAGIGLGAGAAGIFLFGLDQSVGIILTVVGVAILLTALVLYVRHLVNRRQHIAVAREKNAADLRDATVTNDREKQEI